MMSYESTKPNARYWVLKLLKDHLGPGDTLVETKGGNGDLAVQGFQRGSSKMLLVINKRNRSQQIQLPEGAQTGHIALVAPSTGDAPAAESTLSGRSLDLQPFEVALISY